MIRAYIGKPGGGKTYRALLKEIIDELLWGEKFVTTSVAVLPEELAAYFHEVYPNEPFVDLHKRLRVLTDEEAKKFWLHPMPGVDLEDTSEAEQKAGIFPDFTPYVNVLFVIDEAHKHFDARGYQTEGYALTHVNSQHRKLIWDIVFITQFPELISKRIKGFVQEWHDCRNFAVERIFNIFSMPRRFYVKITQREPSDAKEEPGNYEVYKIDLRVAKCYDTSAGVGIKGRRTPEKQRKRGLAIGWLAVPFLALMAVLFFAPDMLTSWALRSESGQKIKQQFNGYPAKPKTNPSDTGQTPKSAGADRRDASLAAPELRASDVLSKAAPFSVPSPLSPPVSSSPLPPGVVPTGYVTAGGVVHVLLSDGTRIVQGVPGVNDPVRIDGVHRNGVVINGHKFFFKAPPLREPVPKIAALPAATPSQQVLPSGPQVGDVRDGRVYTQDGTWRIPDSASVNQFGRVDSNSSSTGQQTSRNVKQNVDFSKSELHVSRR